MLLILIFNFKKEKRIYIKDAIGPNYGRFQTGFFFIAFREVCKLSVRDARKTKFKKVVN